MISTLLSIAFLTNRLAPQQDQEWVRGGGIVGFSVNEDRNQELSNQLFSTIVSDQLTRTEFVALIDQDEYEVHFKEDLAILIDKDLMSSRSLQRSIDLMEYLKSRVNGNYTLIKFDSLPDEIKAAYIEFTGLSEEFELDMTGHSFLVAAAVDGEITNPNMDPRKFRINYSNIDIQDDGKTKQTTISIPEWPETKPFRIYAKSNTSKGALPIAHLDFFFFGMNQTETGRIISDFYFDRLVGLKTRARELVANMFYKMMGSSISYYGNILDPQGQKYSDMPDYLKEVIRRNIMSNIGADLFRDQVTGGTDMQRLADYLDQCTMRAGPVVTLRYNYVREDGKEVRILHNLSGSGNRS